MFVESIFQAFMRKYAGVLRLFTVRASKSVVQVLKLWSYGPCGTERTDLLSASDMPDGCT